MALSQKKVDCLFAAGDELAPQLKAFKNLVVLFTSVEQEIERRFGEFVCSESEASF